ncbi:MAG TPA: ABC transporter ATP-binding protein [Candidatus Cybelea sp.]|jgi:ABC-2 type transport system ATP-binding protein|nr:ABC transporter ATP-binding protein [Candidatus Cybelea sp.]
MDDRTVLRFERVEKSYGAVRALEGVSFAVERNEIVALLGPNGAGKTTGLEIACGLRRCDAGSVRLFGEPPTSVAARQRLGVTPQESGFPDMLRVDEILTFVAQHYPAASPVSVALARFGLEALRKRRAGTLSGGESRRLALALAFVGNPDLVVLDEPSAGLDVQSRRRLWDVVRESARDRSILLTTHYLEEAQALASRILVIDRGRLLFDGDASTLRDRVGDRRVSYVGNDGPVLVTPSDADAYVRALVQSGAAFTDLEISKPSLEEAFLSLTGGSV